MDNSTFENVRELYQKIWFTKAGLARVKSIEAAFASLDQGQGSYIGFKIGGKTFDDFFLSKEEADLFVHNFLLPLHEKMSNGMREDEKKFAEL